ncbi:MAG: sulfite exporter TauE/SafE family protein [Candidatus Heimdallarchaeota archaeon]|nr:sulfite exporter TauE/SafE family protein [Candidatus Heimdallarchaeota archaeon]
MSLIYLLVALISILVSSVSIIGGLGGGILLIPILTIGFGFPLKIVIGSVLISLSIPASIGAFGAWRRDELDLRLAILFEIPTIIGAYFGARYSVSASDMQISLTFGVIAIFLSIQMIHKANQTRMGVLPKQSKFWKFIGSIPPVYEFSKGEYKYYVSISSLFCAGIIIGFLAGLLGVGGGWIKSPLLILGFGIPPFIATGTAIFMILITSITGGLTHIMYGVSDSSLILALMIGLGIGALVGNKLKEKLKSYQISFIIGIILVIVSMLMIYTALA